MPRSRLLSKANLTATAAADDATRYQMHAILLDPAGVVSTDGEWMLITPYPVGDPSEYPGERPTGAADGTEHLFDLDGSIIPLPACKALAKGLKERIEAMAKSGVVRGLS